MSLIPALFLQPKRQIGYLVPDVVIKEAHTDSLTLTSHPVESGAAISDHAWVEPATLEMSVAFSANSTLIDLTETSSVRIGSGLSITESYNALLELQRQRKPLDVVTGKRSYSNMLISKIAVTTSVDSEYALLVDLTLTEVIITRSRTVRAADKASMQQGVATADVENSGKKVTRPVVERVDLTWLGGLF